MTVKANPNSSATPPGISRRARLFGPLLTVLSLAVLAAGGVLQWRLHRVALQPLSIVHVGTEKHLVKSLQESTVGLLDAENGISFGRRLREMRRTLREWESTHNRLLEATEKKNITPPEILRPLETRVFPLYDDVVRSIKDVFEKLSAEEGRVTVEELKPFVLKARNLTEDYLFYLDHLDLILAGITRDEILSLQRFEGILILVAGLMLMGLIFWLFIPVRRGMRQLIHRLNESLENIKEKNRLLSNMSVLINERLQAALDVSKTGTFVWSGESGDLEWDRNLADLYGVEHPEQIRKVEDFLERVLEQDRQKVINHIARTRELGEDSIEFRVKVGDEVRWLRDTSRKITHDHEVKIVGACIDQSALKREIEQSGLARIQAESAMKTKTEFIANMSHDMRTPLAAILGFTELLQREEGKAGGQKKRFLALIRENGEKLLKLIEELLDVARLESGRNIVLAKSFSLEKSMDRMHEAFVQLAKQKDLKLEINYHDPVPETIVSDPSLIEQILLSLLSNAVHYSNEGLITVDVYLRQPDARDGETMLTVEVTDQGQGIDSRRYQTIFEAFSPRGSSVNGHRSTGLGLYVSRKLAVSMGGELTLVRSEIGAGSTFRMNVPVKIPSVPLREKAPPVLPSVPARQDFSGLTVLVVEDDPSMQLLLQAVFNGLNIDCRIAEDGESALEILKENNFDLVTMDIRLPKMSGIEVIETLRQEGYLGYIVAVTAHAFTRERERAFHAGCDEYLTKPIDVKELVAIAKMLLKQKRGKPEAEPSITA